MVELYLHYPIPLNGVVFNWLSIGTTLSFAFTPFAHFCSSSNNLSVSVKETNMNVNVFELLVGIMKNGGIIGLRHGTSVLLALNKFGNYHFRFYKNDSSCRNNTHFSEWLWCEKMLLRYFFSFLLIQITYWVSLLDLCHKSPWILVTFRRKLVCFLITIKQQQVYYSVVTVLLTICVIVTLCNDGFYLHKLCYMYWKFPGI
jgi:hypothetical protein